MTKTNVEEKGDRTDKYIWTMEGIFFGMVVMNLLMFVGLSVLGSSKGTTVDLFVWGVLTTFAAISIALDFKVEKMKAKKDVLKSKMRLFQKKTFLFVGFVLIAAMMQMIIFVAFLGGMPAETALMAVHNILTLFMILIAVLSILALAVITFVNKIITFKSLQNKN